jgi:hypothetical protein
MYAFVWLVGAYILHKIDKALGNLIVGKSYHPVVEVMTAIQWSIRYFKWLFIAGTVIVLTTLL